MFNKLLLLIGACFSFADQSIEYFIYTSSLQKRNKLLYFLLLLIDEKEGRNSNRNETINP